tara:strand:- start:188 stop:385 length:198 start_codon:yes stop_codon:yes gene_type:complete
MVQESLNSVRILWELLGYFVGVVRVCDSVRVCGSVRILWELLGFFVVMLGHATGGGQDFVWSCGV